MTVCNRSGIHGTSGGVQDIPVDDLSLYKLSFAIQPFLQIPFLNLTSVYFSLAWLPYLSTERSNYKLGASSTTRQTRRAAANKLIGGLGHWGKRGSVKEVLSNKGRNARDIFTVR